jgi:hypothetical protein
MMLAFVGRSQATSPGIPALTLAQNGLLVSPQAGGLAATAASVTVEEHQEQAP